MGRGRPRDGRVHAPASYSALAGNRGRAAVQQAQREMRAIPEWSAPRYWAGFVVLGDPGTHVTLSRR
ncbi:MAG: hypothetical protein IPJ04_14825 [Candidatus Eisenbacteria bacterium]|nr:hypothetical protein [Candidatus Eisenbacteria bacterium]